MSSTATQAGNGDENVPYGPRRQPWGEQVPEGATVTAPLDDPVTIYEPVPPANVEGDFPQIDYALFEVPPVGLTDDERATALAAFRTFIETQHATFSGFQADQDQSYAGVFSYLLDMHANNIGDPFSAGRYTLNSKFCERAVLDWFAALWNVFGFAAMLFTYLGVSFLLSGKHSYLAEPDSPLTGWAWLFAAVYAAGVGSLAVFGARSRRGPRAPAAAPPAPATPVSPA